MSRESFASNEDSKENKRIKEAQKEMKELEQEKMYEDTNHLYSNAAMIGLEIGSNYKIFSSRGKLIEPN